MSMIDGVFLECIVLLRKCIVYVGFSPNYTLSNKLSYKDLPTSMYSMYSFFLKNNLIYNIYSNTFFPTKLYILYTTFLKPFADATFGGEGFSSNYTLNPTFSLKNHTL